MAAWQWWAFYASSPHSRCLEWHPWARLVSLPDSLWVVTAQPMSRMSSWGAAGVQCSSLGWHVILSLSPVHGQQRLRLAAWAVNVSACENRLVPVLEIA
eukprot:CAMPEP_0117601594 /NCGR_PEP_ID=MMETSP0784-20121206/77116_1 /TAXON_ID=39447 /ORGANISM="" /LENGTH=98 /DNA_ID=CAMNT_0005404327 /DNA_START=560 /DNA_END=852 /DNA_ORIENTATION=-